MLHTLSLSCGCTLADLPGLLAEPPRAGQGRYCDYHGRGVGITEVTSREAPDEPEPDPLYGCECCRRPWTGYHLIVGSGDAAEPLCLCPCGRNVGDTCDPWICRGAL